VGWGLSRAVETVAIDKFLDAITDAAAGLVIEGEAGIGKTTLWLSATEQARAGGFRVLSARPGPQEVSLTYGALADLVADVEPSALGDLPEAQRKALEPILLGGEPYAGANERLFGAAFVSLLERLAHLSPVVVAVDDAQWLDTSSEAVLAFAARRVTGRVGILATVRSGAEYSHAASWVELTHAHKVDRVGVTPLSLGAVHALVAARLGRSLPRPTMTRIHALSRGNPLYALELARMMAGDPHGPNDRLPASLATLVQSRIERMDQPVQDALLAAAAAAVPTVEKIAAACGADTDFVVDLLEEAEAAGVVDIVGNRIEFTHPLLATGVYADARPARRRAVHRKLAIIVEEPELKARHMALAATTGDTATLEALDAAAVITRTKGAPAAAAELMDLAIGLGGDTPIRRIQSADNHFRAGNVIKARTVLEPAVGLLESGVLRAIALMLLAGLCIYTDGFIQAAEYLQDALKHAGDHPRLTVQTLLMLSFAQINADRLDEALHNAQRAATEAEPLDVPSLTSQVLSMLTMLKAVRGDGIDEAGMQRAQELEDPSVEVPIVFRASANNAQLLAWKGDLDAAHALMSEVRRSCEECGAEDQLLVVAVHSVLIELWRGNLADAAVLAQDASERAEQVGGDNSLLIAMTVQTAAAAYQGRERDARDYGRRALEAAARCGSDRVGLWPTMMLGFLEVSLGRYEDALDTLKPLVTWFREDPRCTEIAHATFIPDAVEAMVALGCIDEAEPLTAAMEQNGAHFDRPWMLAVGARCRAMILAARGDVAAATESAQRAMTEHGRLPMPFERARTQLLLGQLQRRSRQREAASATFREAQRAFEKIGAAPWAARANAERERAKSAWSRDLALSPSEQRIAESAASGMTNKQIAAALFITEKTVEANMTRIYRKLGIRARAELGWHLKRGNG
jgi:DNA-binding CsgD family transcriptional regulator